MMYLFAFAARRRLGGLVTLLCCAGIVFSLWAKPLAAAIPQAPGGPILLITNPSDTFSDYYQEMLFNEGFNAFAARPLNEITAGVLAGHDVVILAPISLSVAQRDMFTSWVTGGGRLIAMRPDKQLAGLLGLADAQATLSEGYLLIDTSKTPGHGLVNQTIQFHGTADRYTLSGAESLATLYANASTPTANPAVTLRAVGGNGGQAAAFTYDLARSIVYTRQGNPAWAAQERDGFSPIRSDDKFYGSAAGDPQPDWINLNKVAIPQADEQQRLLANLILKMNVAKKPLPRFWYFPRGEKAVVLMTGDDHANNGTEGRFNRFKQLSPAGCSVANWQCVRGTSYVYPATPLSNATASAFNADGFEISLHLSTSCGDFTPASLRSSYTQQLGQFAAAFPSLPAPITQRHHCIVWSDWVTGALVQLENGIRLDTSYYYWPPGWVQNRPGFFNGSGMPMRFVDLNGNRIDVYLTETQMTDESGQTYPFTIDTLLDRAVGAEGYYGIFTVNAHTDWNNGDGTYPVSDPVVASALARSVPVITSRQLLTWLDGRNKSKFAALSMSGGILNFNIVPDPAGGAVGLQGMLPTVSAQGVLLGLRRNDNPVSFERRTIKGVEYALFAATAGSYEATYQSDTTPPTVTSTSPADGAVNVSFAAHVTATFSESLDPQTVNGSTVQLRTGSGQTVSGTVTYSNGIAELTPTNALATATAYTATIKGGSNGVKDTSGTALAADYSWSFTTAASPGSACQQQQPCRIWPSSPTPANTSVSDPNAVELGVKFRSDVAGFISGIRFYKGSGNSGTHAASLWNTSGSLLARATFSNETATGWQQVSFATAVPISANTDYVATYHAPNGNYAANSSYFAASGVDTEPLHALRDGQSGGNGVYAYSSTPNFPTSTFQATNYWVDVDFVLTGGSGDTTPPTVTGTVPSSGATGVAVGTAVTATFSEAMNATTINTSTVELRTPANALVPATVNYDAANVRATLTPGSALTASTTYTARVIGGASGVKDLAGNALAANFSWSFTTAASPPVDSTPPTVTAMVPASGATGVAVGTAATATFSEAMNATTINTSTVELRTPANALVPATVNYDAANMRATLTPGSPLTASTTYTAKVIGGASGVKDLAGNALAANFSWSFTTAASPPGDTTPPTVTGTVPSSGATEAAVGTAVSATFSEAMNATTINTSTIELRAPGNVLVAASVSYDVANLRATLTPGSALTASTTYTAKVIGGASGVKDVAGNVLATDSVWSFTTAAASTSFTIWPATATPSVVADPDTASTELGVKFRADTGGFITGIRFYKGSTNIGTHVGTLWSSSGVQLAQATFTNETASGWQQVNFTIPVAITANTVYVASYHTNVGRYSVDENYFGSAVVNSPLTAPSSSESGGNGVYAYSSTPSFPASTHLASNYWVDVVFVTDAGTAGTTSTSIASQDGYVMESGETTNVGGTVSATGTGTRALRVGDNASDSQQKSIVSFDTSGIPDTATIVSATLRLRRGTVTGTNPFTTHGTCWVDVATGGFGGNTALQTGDFQAAATAPQVASLSNAASNNAWSEGNLNGAGLAAINKTGITQFRVYFALDDNDDTGTDEIGYYSGEAAGANQPQLVLTYQP